MTRLCHHQKEDPATKLRYLEWYDMSCWNNGPMNPRYSRPRDSLHNCQTSPGLQCRTITDASAVEHFVLAQGRKSYGYKMSRLFFDKTGPMTLDMSKTV